MPIKAAARTPVIAAVAALLLVAAGYAAWMRFHPGGTLDNAAPCAQAQPCRHVLDYAGFLPPGDVPRFEQYLADILRESDVDARFVFVRATGAQSLEELATDLVARLRIGGRTGDRRGILLLFDTTGRRLKVEVGYGLEGHFPDAFASYLVRDHARMFFASGDYSLGLRWMLRLLQHRIREAVLGERFDPRVLETLRAAELSGGAGVSATLPQAGPAATAPTRAPAPGRFDPGSTPRETFATYLAWLAQPEFEPTAVFLTAESRAYAASRPISPAYRQFILYGESGKRFELVERGDLAILYFTNTPFTSPHFFVREGGRWYMDVSAEVSNTVEYVGGALTWGYRGKDDAYTRAFSDLLTMVGPIRRFANGDNRRLPTR